MKKVILSVALATLAQADMCDYYFNQLIKYTDKALYFHKMQKKSDMCNAIVRAGEYAIDTKMACRSEAMSKGIDDMMEEGNKLYETSCKAKK